GPASRQARGTAEPPLAGDSETLYDADGPSKATCRRAPARPSAASAWNGAAPRQGRHSARPVGNCAASASTGCDAALWLRGSTRGGTMSAYRFYVGLDWATEAHRVVVQDAERQGVAERTVPHEG